MNQKNSLGLDICFKDEDNPFKLFEEWFDLAKEKEPNDPNALALATSDKEGNPNVRMVLLKGFSEKGFVFYTNLNSKKSVDIKSNKNGSMCFHWKSLLRQIRITGEISKISDKEADAYYTTRSYGSRIGAWASKQSSILKNRDELYKSIEEFKKKYPDNHTVPRPNYWSGWILNPFEMEFWLHGKDRVHQRLLYIKNTKEMWSRSLLNP